jgi:hypothetical protein
VKRFLLFYGETYYPSRAWRDFHGSFDTVEEARAAIPKDTEAPDWDSAPDWVQIVDTHTMSYEEFKP